MDDQQKYLDEIAYLHQLLDAHGIAYRIPAWQKPVRAQPEKLRPGVFHQYFHGRDDLYAIQGIHGGWYLPCANRWDPQCRKNNPALAGRKHLCRDCPLKNRPPFTKEVLLNHLRGKGPAAIYPILDNDTCRFIVFDFGQEKEDQQEWACRQADLVAAALKEAGFDFLKERTANGKGARVFVFFEEAISVSKANDLARMTILFWAVRHPLADFSLVDHILPQAVRQTKEQFGMHVALPLQGEVRHLGWSVFVDENWKPYPDQWRALGQVKRLSPDQIDTFLRQCKKEGIAARLEQAGQMLSPSSQSSDALSLFEAVDQPVPSVLGTHKAIRIVLGRGVEIETALLDETMQASLILMGCFWNPALKSKRFAAHPVIIQQSRLENDRIFLPRAFLPAVEKALTQYGLTYVIEDRRQDGIPFDVDFQATLRDYQMPLAQALLEKPYGILEAATGAGKTMIGASLIAQVKKSALILVPSTTILREWFKTLNEVLSFGNSAGISSKVYPGEIGVLQGSINTLTGRVDIAMIPSLEKKEDLAALVSGYGLVLVDECHHAGAKSYQKVLNVLSASRVYGLSATPQRTDGLSRLMHGQLGQVAASFTPQDQMKGQDFKRRIYPRMTRFLASPESEGDFMRLLQEAAHHPLRNAQIAADVKEALLQGRNGLILTRLVEHARVLARLLSDCGKEVLVFAGDPAQSQANARRLAEIEDPSQVLLIGTEKSLGEGFNFPALDTLFLALPMKSATIVSQALGRVHRSNDGKQSALVYDYADVHVPMLERMYRHRLGEYGRQGYVLSAADSPDNDAAIGTLFDGTNYLEAYQQDLDQVKRSIYFCARTLEETQARRLLDQFAGALARGVKIHIETETIDPAISTLFDHPRIEMILSQRVTRRCVIIDSEIVWYGQILTRGGGQDGIMRLHSASMAQELLTWEEAPLH